MKYNPKLPLNIRLAKRRRQKRIRALALFAVFLIIAVFVVTGWYKELLDGKPAESTAGVVSDLGSDLSAISGENESKPENNLNGNKKPRPSSRSDGTNRTPVFQQNNGTVETGTSLESGNNEIASSAEYIGSGEGGSEQIVKKKELSELKSELESYIKKFKGQYGIYYINLVSGEEFGINDSSVYIAASTVKIPLNLYLFKKIENGSVNPENRMTYLERDYEGGTGSIQYKKVGSTYTVRELSKLSIEVSDNVATNMLLRLLGRKNLKDYMRKLGGTVVEDNKNVSCPKDMALYMKKVYEFYKSNKELGGELVRYLENTIFNERIPKLLPKEVKVAHKIGNQVGAIHDVGIVFAEKPYVISVMSKNIESETEAYDIIANISKKVYDFTVSEK